jgi:hypothetical protein
VKSSLKDLEAQETELAQTPATASSAGAIRPDCPQAPIEFWSDTTATSAFCDVHDRADREQVSLRDAAYLIAIERVARACHERGWV